MVQIAIGPEHLVDWQRFVPVGQNSEDWQTLCSFKGAKPTASSRRIRLLSLAQLVRRVAANGVAGKFIECGCWGGFSTHVIARTMTLCGLQQRLMVFDSFEGLSAPSPEDFKVHANHVDSIGQQAKLRSGETLFACPLETAQEHLREHDFVDFYPGWIPDTFAGHEDERFAFGHVDVDLYQPTKASLEFIYERLSPGGIIQIDDYNFVDWPGAQQAVDEFLPRAKPSFFFQLPLGGAFLIK